MSFEQRLADIQTRGSKPTQKIMNYVDTKETLHSKNYNRALDLLEFHLYLRSKRLWTLQSQIKFIKQVDKHVKKAIKKENSQLLEFYKFILATHFRNLLLERSKLNEKGKNPFSVFLKDCEDTKVQDYNLGANYIDFLINEDDGYIHHSILEDVKEKCQSSRFKLGKTDDEEEMESEEEREMQREEQREREAEQRLQQMHLSPRTQRRVQRMLREY